MLSPEIKKIRIKLDKIDSSLLVIIKKRALLVKKILKLKKNKKEIIDKKRIKYILKKIRIKSLKMNLDPKITKNIWATMISSFIDYEYRNFKKK